MTKEEQSIIKSMRKILKKNPNHRFFVASKRGGNGRGKGIERAVILHSPDGTRWTQYYKVWGDNNVGRAKEIIRQATNPTPCPNES